MLQVRSPTLNFVPHALHVVQVVGLVPILGEHSSRLLSLLYLPSPELPLGSLTVHKPAVRRPESRGQSNPHIRCSHMGTSFGLAACVVLLLIKVYAV